MLYAIDTTHTASRKTHIFFSLPEVQLGQTSLILGQSESPKLFLFAKCYKTYSKHFVQICFVTFFTFRSLHTFHQYLVLQLFCCKANPFSVLIAVMGFIEQVFVTRTYTCSINFFFIPARVVGVKCSDYYLKQMLKVMFFFIFHNNVGLGLRNYALTTRLYRLVKHS